MGRLHGRVHRLRDEKPLPHHYPTHRHRFVIFPLQVKTIMLNVGSLLSLFLSPNVRSGQSCISCSSSAPLPCLSRPLSTSFRQALTIGVLGVAGLLRFYNSDPDAKPEPDHSWARILEAEEREKRMAQKELDAAREKFQSSKPTA